MGVYTSGPLWGRIVDRKGLRIPLISASICLFVGYFGIERVYHDDAMARLCRHYSCPFILRSQRVC
ncbi:hypothetical protein OG21DRAFT_1516744 [Imleria badia]|nr:hypothetical protein OG21DRAFT_1516744 [Imleria badia]